MSVLDGVCRPQPGVLGRSPLFKGLPQSGAMKRSTFTALFAEFVDQAPVPGGGLVLVDEAQSLLRLNDR